MDADGWHIIHFGHLALSGAALLTIEATAVKPGRITYADVAFTQTSEKLPGTRAGGHPPGSGMPIAIQLSHAGRKASTDVPWEGGEPYTRRA